MNIASQFLSRYPLYKKERHQKNSNINILSHKIFHELFLIVHLGSLVKQRSISDSSRCALNWRKCKLLRAPGSDTFRDKNVVSVVTRRLTPTMSSRIVRQFLYLFTPICNSSIKFKLNCYNCENTTLKSFFFSNWQPRHNLTWFPKHFLWHKWWPIQRTTTPSAA